MLKKLLLAALVALPMMANAQKFGYVNTQEIFNVMPEKATAENTLKAAADKYDAELKNLQDKFQKDLADFETLEKDTTTPAGIKERRQGELEELYKKIQNFQQTAQQDLQRQQEQLIAPVSTKLQNAIQAVGAEGGYTFIFDLSIPSVVYHGTNAEDVSAKVKAKLGIK